VTFAAERLIDWGTAAKVGDRVAGSGIPLASVERARLFEDFAEVVPQADSLVQEFTALGPGGGRSRPWVMTRAQWLKANLHGFERLLEPFAEKILSNRSEGAMAKVRRNVLGAQLGGLLGYLSHRVLGQYDVFLPPDDDGLIYFVGPNVVGLERKFRFPQRDFRLWLSLHEVTHRLQFADSQWLRGYLTSLMDTYLNTVEVDPGWLAARFREALSDLRSGRSDYKGFGWVFLLMTPDQRDLVRKMQAVMSLVEGHGNYVMDQVSKGRISDARLFRRRLQERRNKSGLEKTFQKAIGFDVKVRQDDLGENFVAKVVKLAGMERFNRVWERPETLPTIEEIAQPEAWVARVAAA